MIVDKRDSLPDGPTTAIPADAPPSYADTLQIPSDQLPLGRNEKSPKARQNQLHTYPLPESSPSSPSSHSHRTNTPGSSCSPYSSQRPSTSQPNPKPFSFKFWPSRTTKEVRTTVLGLVRDLVREHQPLDSNASAPIGILQSCYDVCTNNELSLSSLLQEKSIEGHTPLYWAILKRKPDDEITEDSSVPDLLTALLSFAAPLKQEAISEIRIACLLNSDQLLFQRLRMSPEFSSARPSDQMLLGDGIPPDNILVEDVPGDEGAFIAHFEIVRFQKRMWVTKEIVLEFIARSRLWRLAFTIMPDGYAYHHYGAPKPGTWCLNLSILESSPPTWIDSQFIVLDPQSQPPLQSLPSARALLPALSGSSSSSSAAPSSSTSTTTASPIPSTSGRNKQKPRPTVALRLKSNKQLVTASSKRYQHDVDSEVIVSLEDSLMGSSLQYAGSSYIGPDETLRGRWEARLAKPEAECIIC